MWTRGYLAHTFTAFQADRSENSRRCCIAHSEINLRQRREMTHRQSVLYTYSKTNGLEEVLSERDEALMVHQ